MQYITSVRVYAHMYMCVELCLSHLWMTLFCKAYPFFIITTMSFVEPKLVSA